VWWLWLNRFVREINEDGTNYTFWVKWYGEVPPPLSSRRRRALEQKAKNCPRPTADVGVSMRLAPRLGPGARPAHAILTG